MRGSLGYLIAKKNSLLLQYLNYLYYNLLEPNNCDFTQPFKFDNFKETLNKIIDNNDNGCGWKSWFST